MKQRIWAFLAMLLLLYGLAGSALAANPVDDYTGELDPSTGLPLGSYVNAEGQIGHFITVDNAFLYDPEANRFLYSLGNLRYSSNIPNGAVVAADTVVSIYLPGGIVGTLYRDGAAVSNPDLTAIRETGSYVLQLSGNGFYDKDQFTFVILPTQTNKLNNLRLPAGFSFDYILKDGKQIDLAYSNYYEFKEDGQYQLCWKNYTLNQGYTVKFTLDRQAPTLALPEVKDGKANSAVSLSDLEENCYIVVEYGGKTETLRGNTHSLKESGNYVLTVYDQTGNFTRYTFTIAFYLNISAVFVVIIVLAILAAILSYCYWVRKKIRVG